MTLQDLQLYINLYPRDKNQTVKIEVNGKFYDLKELQYETDFSCYILKAKDNEA